MHRLGRRAGDAQAVTCCPVDVISTRTRCLCRINVGDAVHAVSSHDLSDQLLRFGTDEIGRRSAASLAGVGFRLDEGEESGEERRFRR